MCVCVVLYILFLFIFCLLLFTFCVCVCVCARSVFLSDTQILRTTDALSQQYMALGALWTERVQTF